MCRNRELQLYLHEGRRLEVSQPRELDALRIGRRDAVSREPSARLLLRIGAAFAFVYPPVKALVDPIPWLGYIPSFVRPLPVQLGLPIGSLVLLHAFSIVE